MKKTVFFLLAFLLLGGLAYYVMTSEKEKSTGSTGVSADMDFAVPNVEDVGKIFLADRSGKSVTLERKDGFWLFNGKWRARPTAVENILAVLKDVRVDYLAPEAATQSMVNSVATHGIKVEVYDKLDKKLKTFYVGGVTNDERGTYFMMEDAEQPYVVHLPYFIGALRARFFVEADDWRDRAVFYEKPESIERVEVQYPLSKNESFILEKTGTAEYSVKPYYATQKVINRSPRKGIPESYILQFESLVAEAYENESPARDSITSMVPFAIIEVKKTDGSEKSVRFFPIEIYREQETGQKIVTRYFADCSWGDLMLVQDLVFNPIFRGYDYFFARDADARRVEQ